MRARKAELLSQVNAGQSTEVAPKTASQVEAQGRGHHRLRSGAGNGELVGGSLPAADQGALYGTRRTRLPDLLGDWKQAVVDATVDEFARALIAPHIDQALSAGEQELGRELTKAEVRAVVRAVTQANLPAARLQVEPGVRADERQAFDEAIERWRPALGGKKDLGPMIQGGRGTRTDEIVLWESARALVVVDTFSESPKALIFPKPPVELPIDLPAAELAYVAKVAAQVADAFRDAFPKAKPEIWVNPPQHLMVQQMHVHVQPHVQGYADLGVGEEPATKDLRRFFAPFKAHLARRLGPSQPAR